MPKAQSLRDVARKQAVQEAIHEISLAEIAATLNEEGVTPLIFKGWAVARNYAETWTRPYGDFDLVAPPGKRHVAREVLASRTPSGSQRMDLDSFVILDATGVLPTVVDFHDELPSYYATPLEGLFARAQLVALPGGGHVLVPGPEDHLRLVILHFFKHGAWRPLWLCDIAALAEKAGPRFDWRLCFTDDDIARQWIVAGLLAARELLDCDLGHAPLEAGSRNPDWLMRTILGEWRAPYASRFHSTTSGEPNYFLAKAASYWLNPIASAFLLDAPPPSNGVMAMPMQATYAGAAIGRAVLKSFWPRRIA